MATNRCLRCGQPCRDDAMLCEACVALLKRPHVSQSALFTENNSEPEFATQATSNADNIQQSSFIASATPLALPPEDQGDVALHMLNLAARRIEAVDQKPLKRPRSSRLSPYRDISAEIQRHSTPMPQAQRTDGLQNDFDWPLVDEEVESEQDDWQDLADPLASRHLPGSGDGERIEQEDMERARADSGVTLPLPGRHLRMRYTRLRLLVICLVVLAALGLVTDSVLASLTFLQTQHHAAPVAAAHRGLPTLTLSANKVNYGQSVVIHIAAFTPGGSVFLTHDVGEAIKTEAGSGQVRVDKNGSRDVKLLIDQSWDTGSHVIEAEDMNTRYTASVTLLVASGPTKPSQLGLNDTQLNFGSDLLGANTIQNVVLRNSGGGSISWSASSNQPWLMITPNQGTFSDSQAVVIGVQRSNLKPSSYQGLITISSNVGKSEHVHVVMQVRGLPKNPGAVLTATPVVMGFTAVDGSGNSQEQSLLITNPGNLPLSWSLGSNLPDTLANPSPISSSNWLSLDQSSGIVQPGMAAQVHVRVNSSNLLPGVYINTLLFNAASGFSALNNPQNVAVSLTVQPPCGVTLNSTNLSFTAVENQGNPIRQALNLSTTTSCTGSVRWQATPSANWVTLTPASGLLNNSMNASIAVGVNITGVKPGTYTATVSLVTPNMTQSIPVQLVVQPPPPPGAPIMAVSPLNLNFSTTQGQSNPPGQTVTITNTGKSPLAWHTGVSALAPSWLGSSPSGGTIQPGDSVHLTVAVAANNLTPGSYTGQIVLSATDGDGNAIDGSPQTVMVSFAVQAPCSLSAPSSSALAFTALQSAGSVSPLSETFTASGNCSWPLNWNASMASTASWLNLSATSGQFHDSTQSVMLSVTPNITGLQPGTYQAKVQVAATDAAGLVAQGSPQSFVVTLTVIQPCTLLASSTSLPLSVTLAQSPMTTQQITISEIGTCANPISWTVSVNAGSSTWLTATPASGTNNGTLTVNVDATTLVAGTYQGTITVTATTSDSSVVQGSPLSIPVTLVVT